METFLHYLPLILVVLVVISGAIAIAVKRPKEIKRWLLMAVTQAERYLGSGTGQLKLNYVYDKFVSKYPVIAIFVSFETFAKWVDFALDELKELMESSEQIEAYVVNATEEEDDAE